MTQQRSIVLMVVLVCCLNACGPDTIFLRPGLDTPAQHVTNGHSLLSYGKIDAAKAEFLRATTLDGNYIPAWVGIALVQGHQGNIDEGFNTLERAKELTRTPEEIEALNQGYRKLAEMRFKAPAGSHE